MNKELVTNLLIKYLGPIAPVPVEDELIRRIVAVEYPNGKNVRAALSGMGISDRQRKPYQDALILGRIAGIDNNDELIEYIKENVAIYPGAEVMSIEEKRDIIKSRYPVGTTIYPYDGCSAIVTGYKNWQSGCTLRIKYDDDGRTGTFPPEKGDRLFSPRKP
jgi:hypothetical protein